MGPYPVQQRQVWIKDLKAESYGIVLEIQLAHSHRCLYSKPMKIPRRQLIVTPRLTYHRTGTQCQEQLTEMAYHMIHMITQYERTIHRRQCIDLSMFRIKSEVLTDRYQALLANILAVLKTLTSNLLSSHCHVLLIPRHAPSQIPSV